VVLAFDHGELVDGQPVVVVGLVEVDKTSLVAGDAAVTSLVLDLDAIGKHLVEGAVVDDDGGRLAAKDSADGVGVGAGGQLGVEAGDGGTESIAQGDFGVAGAFLGAPVGPD